MLYPSRWDRVSVRTLQLVYIYPSARVRTCQIRVHVSFRMYEAAIFKRSMYKGIVDELEVQNYVLGHLYQR